MLPATATSGSPPAWPNSTTATSRPASPPAARCLLPGRWPDERDKALHYFETNAPRMHYAWFRSLGLFTGSGVVEAGCKSVIGQRLKLSGMHWTENGATGILTLRCQKPAAGGTKSGRSRPTRHGQPEPI